MSKFFAILATVAALIACAVAQQHLLAAAFSEEDPELKVYYFTMLNGKIAQAAVATDLDASFKQASVGAAAISPAGRYLISVYDVAPNATDNSGSLFFYDAVSGAAASTIHIDYWFPSLVSDESVDNQFYGLCTRISTKATSVCSVDSNLNIEERAAIPDLSSSLVTSVSTYNPAKGVFYHAWGMFANYFVTGYSVGDGHVDFSANFSQQVSTVHGIAYDSDNQQLYVLYAQMSTFVIGTLEDDGTLTPKFKIARLTEENDAVWDQVSYDRRMRAFIVPVLSANMENYWPLYAISIDNGDVTVVIESTDKPYRMFDSVVA